MGDEQDYWNAMSPLRQEGAGLISNFVAPSLLNCAPSVDITRGDNAYWQYCVTPALLFNVQGSAAAELGYCFPRPFFFWTQRYLQSALQHQPRAGASTRARVLWLLDVWAHTVYGLLALNIDLRSGLHRVGPAVDNWLTTGAGRQLMGAGVHPVYQAFVNAQRDQDRSNELLRTTERPTVRTGQEAEWNAAVMMPTPFFELPFDWISNLRGSGEVKTGNPLWTTFYSGVLPWEHNGLRLLSYGSKDAADLRGAVNNAPLTQAVYQWRMMCLQDWGSERFGRETPLGSNASAWSNWWPLGMGHRNNTVALSEYIRNVHYSQRGALQWIAGSPSRLYPTFHTAFSGITRLVRPLTQMNYSEALKSHMSVWATASTRNRLGIPAITFTDSNDLVRAHADAVQARAEAAITNPRLVREADLAAGHRESALEQATNDVFFDGVSIGGKQVVPPLYDTVVNNPLLKPWIAAFQRLFTELVRAVGAATGGAPAWPLIPHPFTRSLQAAGWNTVADGSSLDVLAKIAVAIGNIEVATQIDMGVYIGAWQLNAVPAQTVHDPEHCRVVVSPTSGDFVTQCDDATTPTYTQHSSWEQLRELANPTQLEAAACRSEFDRGLAQSAYRSCITEEDYPLYQLACVAIVRGLAPVLTFEQWAQQLAESRGCRAGTLWTAFVSGFQQRGNPLAIFSKGS